MAISCQGEGFSFEKTMQGTVKFTGKSVIASDTNRFYIKLNPVIDPSKPEEYSFDCPKIVVGNMIIGETYVEPQGPTIVENHTTGEKCELEFKTRGWTSKNKDIVTGDVKDVKGKVRYKLEGKYTEKIELINCETKETEVVWTAPSKPENHHLMYGFNNYALQLNLLTDSLKEKLPPTDSRFRMDTRLWESGKQDESTAQKNRMEVNQRNRKKALKEQLKGKKNMEGDDCEYYTPKYFRKSVHPKTGDTVYSFIEKNERGSNYWMDRDKQSWSHLPRIFDDDCEPFY